MYAETLRHHRHPKQRRRAAHRPAWLLTPSAAGLNAELRQLVWIDATRLGEWVELEVIDAAEADNRAKRGHFPSAVMLGRALYRQEVAERKPSLWVRQAERAVVCDGPDSAWLSALGAGRPQVRFMPAPFGPRVFGYLLTWLLGSSEAVEAGHAPVT